jgi:glycosyltransferase involved in cell wall biosynthesis
MLGHHSVRIETILNPVVASTLLDTPEDQGHRPTNSVPLVLGIGRLVEQKDFGTLLRAFAILRAKRPARLVLLGDGSEARRLQALAQRLGIADDVAMPGEVDNVADWMRRADLLVSSSLWEGLQATLIEALAVGCPVVATDCPGGARETLQDGRLGPLVPVRDSERMARAMIDQLDSPPDPLLLAAGGARFTAAGKAEDYLALFDSLTNGAAKANRPARQGTSAVSVDFRTDRGSRPARPLADTI